MRTVIITGPMGCGKTRGRQSLAASFGCRTIIDDWDPHRHELTTGALHLTNAPVQDYRIGVEVWEFSKLRIREDRLNSDFAKVKPAQFKAEGRA